MTMNPNIKKEGNAKPLITITGVLGKQGRSVARTLLESGQYRVRGITRRVHSSKAKNLIAKGVELISLPLDLGHKKAYVEALCGSARLFLSTPNIAPPDNNEEKLGKQLADAALEAGV